MDETIVAVTAAAAVLVLILLSLRLRKSRQLSSAEPFIELEKLVNCKSCSSLIPEGVRKCAFCGAAQKKE